MHRAVPNHRARGPAPARHRWREIRASVCIAAGVLLGFEHSRNHFPEHSSGEKLMKAYQLDGSRANHVALQFLGTSCQWSDRVDASSSD